MRFSATRAAAILFAAATAALCGCDQAAGTTDKHVKADLAAAHEAMAINDDATAQSSLESAVKIDASPEMKVVANSALARKNLSTAYALTSQIDELEVQLSRVIWEATALAQQIRAGGTAMQAYKQYDPTPVNTAVADKITEAQGSADKRDWVKTGDNSIPTLTAAKQNVSKLEGEIAQLQEQQKNLEAERDKRLTDAAAAAERSENTKGKESVDTFKTASDLRKQAAEKAIDMDKLAIQITRLQADLAVAQGQQAVVEGAIAQMQDNSQKRQSAWGNVDQNVAASRDFAAKLVGPGDNTIAAKVQQIDELVKKIADLRSQAETAANNAVKYYADANKEAQEAQSKIRERISASEGRPEVAAYKDLQDAVQPLVYKLEGAAAQRTLGNLYASEAASLNRRILLRDTVKAAVDSVGQPMPAGLAEGDLNGARNSKLDLADGAYKESEGLLTDVIDGQANESLQTGARVSRVLTYYNWSLLSKLAGKDSDATDHLTKAKQDRDEAAGHQVALPALPAELGAPPAPSTQPQANG